MKKNQTAPQPITAARQDGPAAIALPAPGASLLLQPKLLVGHPDDPLEHEADRAADRVVSLWQGGGFRQPSGDAPTPSGVPLIQRRSASPAAGAVQASPQVTQQIQSAQGGGQALPVTLQPSLEAAFGMDFSGVRLHTDARADALNRDLQARAFTTGRDIFFREGEYQPGTAEGVRLLGHELGHVGQQGGEVIRMTRDRTREQGTIRDQREVSPLRDVVNYVFIFPNDIFGRNAARFYRTYYPDHIMVTGVSSLEEMFDRLYVDLHRMPRESGNVVLGELVLVTHANAAGGLQIPLTRGERRNFNPWSLRELQAEFSDQTNSSYLSRRRFHDRRADVVENFITPSTDIIVRGCNFGQSQEGVTALRLFFGGFADVWAPTVYQGYQYALRIGSANSHLQSVEEAFDMLRRQGMIPDLELDAEEQREYMRLEFGIEDSSRVPSQFFTLDAERVSNLRDLDRRGLGSSERAEELVEREGTTSPSYEGHWALSRSDVSPFDDNAEVGSFLTREEIEQQARGLYENYRPMNAPLLRHLRREWERLYESEDLFDDLIDNVDEDPLSGSAPIEIFGDSNIIDMDAAQYQNYEDLFETTRLPFELPSEILREELNRFDSITGPDSIIENTPEGDNQAETTIDIPRVRPSRRSERERYLASMDFSKDEPPINELEPEEIIPPATEDIFGDSVDSDSDTPLLGFEISQGIPSMTYTRNFTPPLPFFRYGLLREVQAEIAIEIEIDGSVQIDYEDELRLRGNIGLHQFTEGFLRNATLSIVPRAGAGDIGVGLKLTHPNGYEGEFAIYLMREGTPVVGELEVTFPMREIILGTFGDNTVGNIEQAVQELFGLSDRPRIASLKIGIEILPNLATILEDFGRRTVASAITTTAARGAASATVSEGAGSGLATFITFDAAIAAGFVAGGVLAIFGALESLQIADDIPSYQDRFARLVATYANDFNHTMHGQPPSGIGGEAANRFILRAITEQNISREQVFAMARTHDYFWEAATEITEQIRRRISEQWSEDHWFDTYPNMGAGRRMLERSLTIEALRSLIESHRRR